MREAAALPALDPGFLLKAPEVPALPPHSPTSFPRSPRPIPAFPLSLPGLPTSIPDITDDWQQLLGAYAANAAELQSVEALSRELTDALTQVQEYGLQEKASRAERQQFTKRRQETIQRAPGDFADAS